MFSEKRSQIYRFLLNFRRILVTWEPGNLGSWGPGEAGNLGSWGPGEPGNLGSWDPGGLGRLVTLDYWDFGHLKPWKQGPWGPGEVDLSKFDDFY